ncbi:UDP-glucose/GDP-mannose dehydrogenase family protein [Lysinibacillus yapensis]|uniref:UDP-glucose 6-dehydrogenase n=1 Tax=Ureibacillus yapensis TaxID=2304605 RepID=A0A396SSU3_9BACL|nr:UDP-glucose/GDP-mannose dehydrogenase family protein [Lysinibacillus yapensis]RHW39531.1 UDP-glucose/GDP-mannose dehydrogenase family protein [Lysinibacillus yapensis]
MKLAVVGTGYVGLVTGVCLAEIGHHVTCIDIDEMKVEKMKKGIVPIYEPGLSELMNKNMAAGRLSFTSSHNEGFAGAEVVYIAVGTPQKDDGSANLTYVEQVAVTIAKTAKNETIVVTKSTVPVGTNDRLQTIINQNKLSPIKIEVVSNPEFLREGSAIYDSFHGNRIIIGANTEEAAQKIAEINKPFGIFIYKTDIRSAEMIKYASNAFLATKISFINEIANICERVGADVEKVAVGMGLDQRIGSAFLKAGIGYGGSCFPKDTKALIQIAGNVEYDFELLKGVVNVNRKQQRILLNKLRGIVGNFEGKKIAVLGLAFKPDTDDLREAPSILITNELINGGAQVYAYDPIAIENAKKTLNSSIIYVEKLEDALEKADAALILTEWSEIKNMEISLFKTMKNPIVLDGRNCFSLVQMQESNVDYHSVGRRVVRNGIKEVTEW